MRPDTNIEGCCEDQEKGEGGPTISKDRIIRTCSVLRSLFRGTVPCRAGEVDEVEANTRLRGSHQGHRDDHQEPPANHVPEDEADDDREEVGDSYKESAVLG